MSIIRSTGSQTLRSGKIIVHKYYIILLQLNVIRIAFDGIIVYLYRRYKSHIIIT